MEMLEKKAIIAVTVAALGIIGTISYSWAAWATETLIAVDKRTEVMAAQIEFIKVEMERTYGNVQKSNEKASYQARW